METKEIKGFNEISPEELDDINGGKIDILDTMGYAAGVVIGGLCKGWGHVHG